MQDYKKINQGEDCSIIMTTPELSKRFNSTKFFIVDESTQPSLWKDRKAVLVTQDDPTISIPLSIVNKRLPSYTRHMKTRDNLNDMLDVLFLKHKKIIVFVSSEKEVKKIEYKGTIFTIDEVDSFNNSTENSIIVGSYKNMNRGLEFHSSCCIFWNIPMTQIKQLHFAETRLIRPNNIYKHIDIYYNYPFHYIQVRLWLEILLLEDYYGMTIPYHDRTAIGLRDLDSKQRMNYMDHLFSGSVETTDTKTKNDRELLCRFFSHYRRSIQRTIIISDSTK